MIDDTEKQLLVEETTQEDTVEELPEVGAPEPEPQTQANQSEPQQKSPYPTDAERNLAALRAKAEKAERERDELLAYFRQQQEQQAPHQHEPEPEEVIYNDEDLIEGKHLKKERERYKRELDSLKKDIDQYKQQTYQSSLEQKLKSDYPDIEKVLTIENVQAFREAKPRLAQSLAYNPDPYAQAVETYEQIKAMGLVPNAYVDAEKARAQKNTAKPKPTASISPQQGQSPLSQANAFAEGLTPDRKAQLWKEMQEKASGAY